MITPTGVWQTHSGAYIPWAHYSDVIMSTMVSQITSITSVYSISYSGADQRNIKSSTSLAFVGGIHQWPVNSPQKGPVTRKMFPFDDVIMVRHFVVRSRLISKLLYTDIKRKPPCIGGMELVSLYRMFPFIICLILMNYLMEFYFIGFVNAHLPGCFCPWTFRLNIGLNTSPSDSFVSYLNSHLGYSAGEFQALQLIVLAVFGAVD